MADTSTEQPSKGPSPTDSKPNAEAAQHTDPESLKSPAAKTPTPKSSATSASEGEAEQPAVSSEALHDRTSKLKGQILELVDALVASMRDVKGKHRQHLADAQNAMSNAAGYVSQASHYTQKAADKELADEDAANTEEDED